MIKIPCMVNNKSGYNFLHFGVDYVHLPGSYSWDYKSDYSLKTYAFVEDTKGHVMKVKPEKVSFYR